MRRELCFCFALLAAGCGDDLCADGESCPAEEGGGAALGGAPEGGASASGGAGGGEVASVHSTIVVRDGYGMPAKDITVIGNDADGALVAEGVTNDEGEVELVLTTGGSVSAVYDYTYTYADANETVVLTRMVDSVFFNGVPSEDVRLRIARSSKAPPATEPMTLELAAPDRFGAVSYDARTSCANSVSGPSSVIAMQTQSCRSDGKLDILMLARNAAGDIIDHARLDDVIAMPGGFVSYEVKWEGIPIGAVDFETSHIPDDAQSLYLSTAARNTEAGVLLPALQSTTYTNLADHHSVTLSHLSAYGDDHCQFANLGLEVDDAHQLSVQRERCKPVADLSPLFLDATKLSRFQPSVPSREPLVVELTKTMYGAKGTVVLIDSQWKRGDEIGRWRANLAPESERAHFPTLPAAFSAHAIASSDESLVVDLSHKNDLSGTESFEEAVTLGLPLATRDYEASFYRLVP